MSGTVELFEFLGAARERVAAGLRRFLEQKARVFEPVSAVGPAMAARLEQFALRGKLMRGSLVALGALCGDAATPAVAEAVDAAGVAMELLQTALLVHDDIMDRDLERRGGPSIHHLYAGEARRQGLRNPEHTGMSLGICAGDIAFFAAFEVLAGIDAEPAVHRELLEMVARELSGVGIAQAQDVLGGASAAGVTADEVERLYLYKTGRYTLSLPLCAGALLAGATQSTQGSLERIGEHLGIVFQIKDDELGLFGDPEDTGKPAGSDVREGKKTLHYVRLLERAGSEDRRRLEGIYGRPEVTEEELAFVRRLTEDTGVRADVAARALALAEAARTETAVLARSRPAAAGYLLQLLDYSLARTF